MFSEILHQSTLTSHPSPKSAETVFVCLHFVDFVILTKKYFQIWVLILIIPSYRDLYYINYRVVNTPVAIRAEASNLAREI